MRGTNYGDCIQSWSCLNETWFTCLNFFGELLGGVAYNLGQYEVALKNFSRSLVISREIQSKHAEAIRLSNLGQVLLRKNMLVEAVQHASNAIDLSDRIGSDMGSFMPSRLP